MKREYHSSVYGLYLVSDQPIPGLSSLDATQPGSPVISIRFSRNGVENPIENTAGESLWYTSDIPDENGNPALRIWKGDESGAYRIRYSHGLEFCVDQTASFLSVHFLDSMDREDVAAFLLGPVLGILLRLRGLTCLHASAVALGGNAIAFAGPEGAGKSTTAALFTQKGHAALSDDIVALDERGRSFDVLPGYPYLNLWPESVRMICASPDALPRLSPSWEKRHLPLGGEGSKFQRTALPLAAIYLLGARCTQEKAPYVEEVSPRNALVDLVANTYANRLLDATMRAREFRVLGTLVNQLPIRRVILHEDPARLSSLYELICEDCGSARGA